MYNCTTYTKSAHYLHKFRAHSVTHFEHSVHKIKINAKMHLRETRKDCNGAKIHIFYKQTRLLHLYEQREPCLCLDMLLTIHCNFHTEFVRGIAVNTHITTLNERVCREVWLKKSFKF